MRNKYIAILFAILLALLFASGCGKKERVVTIADITVTDVEHTTDLLISSELNLTEISLFFVGYDEDGVVLKSSKVELDFDMIAGKVYKIRPVGFLDFRNYDSFELVDVDAKIRK